MAGDTHWPSVVLALHMDGSNGSTTFTDAKGHAVTAMGNAQISTAQSKFGGASALFDGTGDYLTTPTSTDWEFGSGDFSIRTWFTTTDNTTNQCLVCSVNLQAVPYKGWVLRYDPTQSPAGFRFVAFKGDAGNLSDVAQLSFTPANNTFYLVSVERSGNSVKIFVDGVSIGSVTLVNATTIAASGRQLMIGSQDSVGAASTGLLGRLDDLLITKGVARNTANFTPPASAFLEYAGQLSGVVRDDANALVARTVRAYLRSSGALVGSATSNASTGAYSINAQTLDAHTVIVLDDETGTSYNALVLDRLTPA